MSKQRRPLCKEHQHNRTSRWGHTAHLLVQPWGGLVLLLFLVQPSWSQAAMERIGVAEDRVSFSTRPSGKLFKPWGFNYDHDESGRLLEDYWEREWPKVEEDFREMAQLGANVVRVHLQLGKFMDTTHKTNPRSLKKLRDLLALAERTRLYLDITGLGCYHKADVPAWYDSLSERERWDVQGRFWRAVAREGKKSPAVFCYDLMNEPVAPAGTKKQANWLGPPFGGKHFVQWISQETEGRSREAIASEWIEHLTKAIRKEDKRTLVTVGLVDWSLDRPGLKSGFVPQIVGRHLDFISVHIYPRTGKLPEAAETLRGFAIGKPLVVEETFPLSCSASELESFIKQSSGVSGWIGFYWGKTPEECRKSSQIGDQLTLQWLDLFQRLRANESRHE